MKNKLSRILIMALAVMTAAAATPIYASAAGTTAVSANKDTAGSSMTGYISPNVEELSAEDIARLKKDISSQSARPKSRKSKKRSIRKAASSIDWSRYSSTYFYDKMDSSEKTFYKSLSDSARAFMDNGTTAAVFEVPVSVDEYNKISSEISSLYKIWKTTEAQYFFVANDTVNWKHDASGSYVENGSMHLLVPVIKAYQNASDRRAGRDAFLTTVNSISAKADRASTAVGKEKIVHDELVKRLKYNIADGNSKQSSASSLIGNETVCAGYASAFEVIMNGLGINTISITSSTHQWNETELSDGKWYNVDVTWDDPVDNDGTLPNSSDDKDGGNLRHKYFNVTDAALRDGNSDHTPESIWSNRPVCNNTDSQLKTLKLISQYNTFNMTATYGDVFSSDLITYFIKNDRTAGRYLAAIDDNNNKVNGSWQFMPSVTGQKITSNVGSRNDYAITFVPDRDADSYENLNAYLKLSFARRKITVNIADATKNTGDDNPKFTWSLADGSTLGAGDKDSDLKISLSTDATKSSPAETYPITGTCGNSNYNVTFNNGTFTVKDVEQQTKAPVLTIPSRTITYGDKITDDLLKDSKASDGAGTVDGTFSFAEDYGTLTAGSHDLRVKFTSKDSDYTDVEGALNLTVAKKPITITINNATMTAGDSTPAFSFASEPSDLVNGDIDSAISVEYAVSGDTSKPGTCNITGTATADNYDVTVKPGTLTINPKEKVDPVITKKPSLSLTYGDTLAGKTLIGTASYNDSPISGTFRFAGDVDTSEILTAGKHTVNAVFTPYVTDAYNSVKTTVDVTVAKRKITVMIDDKSKIEGEADPAFTKKVTGTFVGTDKIDDLLTISRRSGESAGNYAITGTVKNTDNYDITVTDGTLTINVKPEEKPAATTVQTAPVLTVTYGDRLSSASITNGSVISDGNAVTGTWKITTSDRVVNKSNASQKITLTFTPSDTTKYSPVSVDVTPTVEKRKITVKADDITRTVGETKAMTYKIINGSLVSGDTESDLKVTLKSSNTSDTAGTYVISGTADVDYYDVTIQNGTLTINAKSSDSGSTSGGSTSGGQTGGNSGNTSGGSGSGSGSSSSDNPSNPSGTTVTTYSITYDLNGGTATGNPSSYRNDSDSITLTAPTRTGYTFIGWTGSNGSTPQTAVTIRKGTTGNLYFVANWQDNNSANNSTTADTGTYKISYNLNGGTVNRSNPVSYTARDTYLINNPWREGYFFAGWTSNLSNIPQMVVTIPRGTTGDITFTATWTLDTSNHATAGNDDNTDVNTQTDDDGWTEWINGNDDSDIPDIPSTSITKTSSGKKSVTMKFKKTSISGYTVKYQVAIKKANAGSWKKSFVSKTSKTFKGLKKKSTYWVSVRPYITVDGTRYFGDWAKTKVRKTR